MKKHLLVMLFFCQLITITKTYSQNIAINGNGSLPDTSAMLDVSSVNKGFLAPRMTTLQQNAIPLPAKGLLIFNTTDNGFKVNIGTPASPSWTALAAGSGTITHALSYANNVLTNTINGIGSSVNIINAVSNSSANNVLSTSVNGITGSGVPIINSVSNTSSANTLSTKINDVSGSSVSIVNTNALSLNGTKLTSTVNGVSSAALELSSLSSSSSSSSSSGWSITGNSGIGSSNFIGTTDGQPLIFKINNTQAGYLGLSGSSNATSFGIGSAAGFSSTAIGANATATSNNEAVAVGYRAAANGYRSIAIGSDAVASSSSGNNETISIGYNAKGNSYQGIAIGSGASTSTGNNSMAIGVGASASGYQSTAIGYGAKAANQNSTAIGNGASSTNDNYISIGNTSVTAIRGQVNFTTYSDGRFKRNIVANVPGLSFILKLRAVTYNWDIHKFNSHSSGQVEGGSIARFVSLQEEAAIFKKERITYTGFIAQEVEKAALDCHFNFSGVLKPQNDKDAYSLSYAEFVVPLVKSVQEINENVELLTDQINQQKEMINYLMEEIKLLKDAAKLK